jgi:hypothetical protein
MGPHGSARRAEFVASRKAVGARERTFLQPTPMGDMVIVTLEGDDPGKSFGRFVFLTDPFTLWFLERVKEIHGVDLRHAASGPMPEQVIDTAS